MTRTDRVWRLMAVAGVSALSVITGCATTGVPLPGSTAPGSAGAGPVVASGTPNPNAPEIVAPGDIPDNQAFVAFSPSGAGFEISVPEGWARSTSGSATVFTDKFNSVRVEAVPRPTAPDPASARAEEVPVLAKAQAFVLTDVTTVSRKGGQAVLITFTAASPVDPVTGKSVVQAVERYEFWQAGREAVLTLANAKGADNVDPWRTISDSFRWR